MSLNGNTYYEDANLAGNLNLVLNDVQSNTAEFTTATIATANITTANITNLIEQNVSAYIATDNLDITSTDSSATVTITNSGGSLQINGNCNVVDNITTTATVNAANYTNFNALELYGTASLGATSVNGIFSATGATTLGSTVAVTGNTTVGGTLGVTGGTTMSTLTTSGTAQLNGTINLAGATNLNGITTVGNTMEVTSAGALTVDSGSLTVFNGNVVTNGTLTGAGTNTLTGVTSLGTSSNAVTSNGNTSVSGSRTFTVGTGATTLGGALTVAGLTTLNGNLTQSGSNTLTTGTGAVAINGSTTVANGKYVQLGSQKLAVTLTLGGSDSGSTYTNNTDMGDTVRIGTCVNYNTTTGSSRAAIFTLQVYPTSGQTTNRMLVDLKAIRVGTGTTGAFAVGLFDSNVSVYQDVLYMARAGSWCSTNLQIGGSSTPSYTCDVQGTLGVSGTASITGNTTITGNLTVSGSTNLSGAQQFNTPASITFVTPSTSLAGYIGTTTGSNTFTTTASTAYTLAIGGIDLARPFHRMALSIVASTYNSGNTLSMTLQAPGGGNFVKNNTYYLQVGGTNYTNMDLNSATPNCQVITSCYPAIVATVILTWSHYPTNTALTSSVQIEGTFSSTVFTANASVQMGGYTQMITNSTTMGLTIAGISGTQPTYAFTYSTQNWG